MSLLQLLTTGRSLVACDSAGRYQVTNKRLVPNFRVKKNPFETPAAVAGSPRRVVVTQPSTVSATAPLASSPVVASPSVEVQVAPAAELPSPAEPQREIPVVLPGEVPARAAVVASQPALAAPVLAAAGAEQRAPDKKTGFFKVLRQELKDFVRGLTGRRLWLEKAATAKSEKAAAAKPAQGTNPAVPAFSKPLVQEELSLEQVKVVRNDLSDTDLELVPRKAQAPEPLSAAPAVAAPAEPAASRPKLQPVDAWNRVSARLRMSTRLFGTGKR
jgi:hypothetical protein